MTKDQLVESLTLVAMASHERSLSRDLSPEICGEALSKMKEVVLLFFYLNPEQMEQILIKTAEKGNTTRLSLSEDVEVPETVPVGVLRSLVVQLEHVTPLKCKIQERIVQHCQETIENLREELKRVRRNKL